ncbi:MAG TPA: glycosyl hydrolase family 18 protein [Acidobacteriaceae bacterium]|nr:glycosyl hydrolase family 18 protein [Acidobacteriaceae bacterium]
MKIFRSLLLVSLVFSVGVVYGQGTAPTFKYIKGQTSVTLPGRDPVQGGTTVIPTVLVPVQLEFDSGPGGKLFTLNAAADARQVLHSPIFANASFGSAGKTQYVDAMLRATTETAGNWHTLLGKPEIRPVTVKIPAGYGYVLISKSTRTTLGMADLEFVQREIFKQIPREDGKLVIAVTHNTGYYAYGDATVCCSFGTHGVDAATGNSFVLASDLGATPPLVQQRDIQPLTEQLAEWVNNPLHDPLFHFAFRKPLPAGENIVTAWMWPSVEGAHHRGCGGTTPAARYTLQDPLDTNERSDLPAGPASLVHAHGASWHLADVALMGWYTGGTGVYSFPNSGMLTAAATPCPAFRRPAAGPSNNEPAPPPTVAAVPFTGSNNGHELIGYWTGSGPGGTILRLRDVSPQWDVIIVAFANVNHQAPEGTLQLHVRPGLDLAQMKDDIAWLKSRGKKVLISLGGGGEYFTLDHTASIPNFVNSVTQIVTDYGFDGVDIDFESPSLVLDPGDTNFRHPKTPSIVNLITGLHQLRDHFGPTFMLSLVPEGTQIPGGYPAFGGQFGTYVPLLWGVRDMLSFVDVQDYNTPPFQGLDGEPYQMGSVNYDAAMTELLLHGFPVGRRAGDFFPPVPANKVAVGFLVGPATPKQVRGAMQYLITGKAPAGVTYKLRRPGGYPGMIGAMFWTIDGDRDENYAFSNFIGPQLHSYPAK